MGLGISPLTCARVKPSEIHNVSREIGRNYRCEFSRAPTTNSNDNETNNNKPNATNTTTNDNNNDNNNSSNNTINSNNNNNSNIVLGYVITVLGDWP